MLEACGKKIRNQLDHCIQTQNEKSRLGGRL
jgi:hypothetical protein